jgi:hypothetical protein
LEFLITDCPRRPILADPVQGGTFAANVTIAAFDAGVYAFAKAAVEIGIQLLQITLSCAVA